MALFAWLLLSLAQQPVTQSRKHVSPTNQRGTPQAPFVVQIDSTQRREEANQHEQEAEKKAAADKALVTATRVLAAIGFLQLIVFGLQAAQLRATVGEMRTNAQIELRAYVHVQLIGISQTDGHMFVKISNAGRTPAHDISTWFMIYNGPQSAFNMHDPEQQPASNLLIPPGGALDYDATLPTLTSEEQTLIAGGEPRIVVVRGHIYYKDVFKQARTSDFEYIIEGDDLARGLFRPTDKGVKAT